MIQKKLTELLCAMIPQKKMKSKVRQYLRSVNYIQDFKDLLKFKLIQIEPNTVMIFEPNPNHGECLPSYIKYFKDLGYKTHLVIKQENFEKNIFCRVPEKYLPDEIFILSQFAQKRLLQKEKIKEYKKGLLASGEHFYSFNAFFEYLGYEPKFQEGCLIIEHDLRNIERYNQQKCYENNRICVLTNFKNDPKLTTITPHYFGDIKITEKNKEMINFIRVGGIDPARRNEGLIVEAVQDLLKRGIKNFKITIVGSGKLKNLPDEIVDFMDIKGKLNFPEMFAEVEKADFLLPLLDPTMEANREYLKYLSTGSRQLILGFLKPCLINEEFAKAYGFNDKNAFVYKNNNIADAMKKAIDMNQIDYGSMQNELAKLSVLKYEDSIKALERKMDEYPIQQAIYE